jgi:hypothetical protein
VDVFEHTTLSQLRREVARVAERCPELATRAQSAAAILLGAKVAEHEDGTFEVFGSVETPYTVDAEANTCTCLDYQHRGVTYRERRFCKHTLAVLLLARLSVRPTVGRRDRVRPFRPAAGRRLRRAA